MINSMFSNFTDVSKFSGSYCHRKYQNEPFFHEVVGREGAIKTFNTEVSIIPPAKNTSCYFTIYKDYIIEDKIYLLPKKQLISQENFFHISPKSNYNYNYDQYVVTKDGAKGKRF